VVKTEKERTKSFGVGGKSGKNPKIFVWMDEASENEIVFDAKTNLVVSE
jgi:hypothetical protein